MPASAAKRPTVQNHSADPLPSSEIAQRISARLLDHYDTHQRALPWRSEPGAPPSPPYTVWLSEVMLQQTTVATVVPRFTRFMLRWPTIEALAAAPDEAILGEWAGLGYYARARNLIACARTVAANGFPATEVELRKLPGLGTYTAAAIAAIAFGERSVVIDTNVERVVARLYGIATPLAAVKSEVRLLADALTPAERPGDHAQAMMDLGATICRPRRPNCASCPLKADCCAFASGNPEGFPAAKAKASRPHRHATAWWIERDSAVWLVRRPPSGLLGGMAALPGPEWNDAAPPANPIASVAHGFTHFTLDLHLVEGTTPPPGDGWWHPLDRLAEAGLPTLYRRAAEAALKRTERAA